LSINPSDFKVQEALGDAFRECGDHASATNSYSTAIELLADASGPDAPALHLKLGGVLWQQAEIEGAVAEYRRAVELAPTDATTNVTLARALRLTGKPHEAARQCRRVLSATPNEPVLHAELGDILLTLEERDRATHSFVQALRLDPECAAAHYGLGRVAEARGKVVEALDRFIRALAADPEHAEARWALRRVRRRARELELKRRGKEPDRLEQ